MVLPSWRCSTCSSGLLLEDKARRIVLEPTFSQELHSEDWWEPEHVRNRFSAVLQCRNPDCGEITFVTGNSFVDDVYDERRQPRVL